MPALRAQSAGQPRRIGVLMSPTEDSPEGQARIAGFREGLRATGWTEGGNLQLDVRWAGGDMGRTRALAGQLVASNPAAILANGTPAVIALKERTSSIPIVFAQIQDPVGLGMVASLARPGGNVTGFTNFEYSIGGKWLELLREIAPDVTRVAVLRESFVASGPGQFGAIQAVAQAHKVELRPIDVRDAGEIERDITAFAQESNGGLIVTGSPAATVHRELINALALKHRLPIVFNSRFYVVNGGLASYGPDFVDMFRRSASYVDRILKGEKPADLPVQAPVKYELTINLKTAKAMGLTLPPALLARADDVIE
jgi:putative ABC transport system substrate-binding protein